MCDHDLFEVPDNEKGEVEECINIISKHSDIKSERVKKLLSKFQPNNFEIWDEQFVTFGHGVFPIGSLINHSCIPNTCLSFVNRTARFHAITNIKKGEEITHTYVDPLSLDRKKHFGKNIDLFVIVNYVKNRKHSKKK
eukprot:UN25246